MITFANLKETFPAPAVENPYAGDPFWTLHTAYFVLAMQILRQVPAGDVQQRALQELRASLDTALTGVDRPPNAEIERRLRQSLAPYVSTPSWLVTNMLALAHVTSADLLYDLGSGDGRIVNMAAQVYGCRAHGLEIDDDLVTQAEHEAQQLGVAHLVLFRACDVKVADLRDATVITAYLLSSSMRELTPKFKALKPGTRIVSHAFDMPGWEPTREVVFGEHKLFLWEV